MPDEAGTLVAFSNNAEPGASYHERIAPIYLAKHGHLVACGFADVEHTLDVTSWKRFSAGRSKILLIFSGRIGNSLRSFISVFRVYVHNGFCNVKPHKPQSIIGTARYKGHTNTLCAMEPFTLDQCLCGKCAAPFKPRPHFLSPYVSSRDFSWPHFRRCTSSGSLSQRDIQSRGRGRVSWRRSTGRAKRPVELLRTLVNSFLWHS